MLPRPIDSNGFIVAKLKCDWKYQDQGYFKSVFPAAVNTAHLGI